MSHGQGKPQNGQGNVREKSGNFVGAHGWTPCKLCWLSKLLGAVVALIGEQYFLIYWLWYQFKRDFLYCDEAWFPNCDISDIWQLIVDFPIICVCMQVVHNSHLCLIEIWNKILLYRSKNWQSWFLIPSHIKKIPTRNSNTFFLGIHTIL